MNQTAEWPTGAGVITGGLIAVLYLFVGVFDHSIWAPVEPTIVGVVWNMVEHGNLAVPFINHEPFVEKPPFYYWLAWATASIGGGLTPGTLRLPAALMGLACLALTYWLARRAYGARIACLTALLGALSLMFWDSAHRAASDISATFFAFVCFSLFARGLDETTEGAAERPNPWDLPFAIALAASFYAKNVFTFLVVIPPVAVFLLLDRQARRLFGILATTGALLAVFLLPWAIAVGAEGGLEQLRIVFFDNTLGRFLPLTEYSARFTTTMSDALIAEKEPWYFYASRLFAYPLPWTPLVLVAVLDLIRTPLRRTPLERFLLVGLVVLPIAMSLSSAKSTDYLIPILFFDFLITGRLLAHWSSGERDLVPWERLLIGANVAIALLLIAVFPIVIFAILGGPSTLLLLPPALLASGMLLHEARREGVNDRWIFQLSAVGALAAAAGLAVAIPAVDQGKSYAPFFDAVRPGARGRRVVTTYHEITRVPLINYYLNTHADRAEDFDAAVELLRSPAPIAAFVRCERYEAAKATLEDIPGLTVLPEPQRGEMCFLTNDRAAPSVL